MQTLDLGLEPQELRVKINLYCINTLCHYSDDIVIVYYGDTKLTNTESIMIMYNQP
jgi:hypothetical protein